MKNKNRSVNCDFTNYADRPKFAMGSQRWRKLNFPGENVYEIGKRTF